MTVSGVRVSPLNSSGTPPVPRPPAPPSRTAHGQNRTALQGQLSERVRTAVFGNIGTLIAFQVGADDAAHIERAMSGEIKAHELTGLGRFEIAVKMPPALGRTGLPLRAITLLPTAKRAGYRAAIIERARTHYGRSRVKPERAIAHFLASEKEKRIAKLTRAMKQKPAPRAEGLAAQFARRVSELQRERDDHAGGIDPRD